MTATANELDKKVFDLLPHYDVGRIMHHLDAVASGQLGEVLNSNNNTLYYQWLAVLTRLLKPKQVVELGAAAGVSTIMIATELPQDAKFYSVDNDPQAWRWIIASYPQVTRILGSDLDMSIWPKDCDLAATDLWFFDTNHTEEQLRKELELYSPHFNKGAVVVLDDIRLNDGMKRVWDELAYDKVENTNPNHYSGFGFFVA